MQEEMFDEKYTPEDIDRFKRELARDVEKLDSLKTERSETNKGYTSAIKILQMQIDNKARIINSAKPVAQNVAKMGS